MRAQTCSQLLNAPLQSVKLETKYSISNAHVSFCKRGGGGGMHQYFSSQLLHMEFSKGSASEVVE